MAVLATISLSSMLIGAIGTGLVQLIILVLLKGLAYLRQPLLRPFWDYMFFMALIIKKKGLTT
jgi:hypothetical protein